MRSAAIRLGSVALLLASCGREEPPDAPLPSASVPDAPVPDSSLQGRSAALRRALDAHDLAAAAGALALLVREHGGASEMPDGRRLPPGATVGAVFDEALAEARRAIDGAAPDRERAERALVLADELGPEVGDGESLNALLAAQRWVALRTLTDLATPLAPHEGPRVVVVADDYDLGEAALRRPLVRWAREGAAGGLRVGVVPMQRGWVRVGIRRTRARDRDEERGAMARRLEGTGLVLEPEPPDADAVAQDVGLQGQESAVLVVDRAGRIAARLAGRNLDPSGLDAVVQKVGSR